MGRIGRAGSRLLGGEFDRETAGLLLCRQSSVDGRADTCDNARLLKRDFYCEMDVVAMFDMLPGGLRVSSTQSIIYIWE